MHTHPMKPETIARRAAERAVEKMTAKATRVERLRALAEQHGAESIWAELLELENMPC